LHFGVAGVAAQSGSSTHCTQRKLSFTSQIAVGAMQSVLARHPTHWPRPTAHFDVGAMHCASVVHADCRHLCSSGSQIGADAPQSEFVRHETQCPLVTSHRGDAAGQSELSAHCTHCFDDASQIGAVAGQSVATRQPEHAPVDMSHLGCSPGHAVIGHAGWHA
jgi:hypothetical protein